jgi:bifunctional DNA-binding transcriptional regulator/antitoxin component of YhaV-PrlF toxin-antitoxin module
MEQCYSTVQGKKTSVYDRRQYDQLFTAFPKKLRRLWDIERGQVLEWQLNGNDEMTVKKVKFKPAHTKMKYEEWLTKIKPHIPVDGAGKTYDEIRKAASVETKTAPAEWVHKAEVEIHLNRTYDRKLHRILWTRSQQPDETDQKEPKFRDQSLSEFQAKYDERKGT